MITWLRPLALSALLLTSSPVVGRAETIVLYSAADTADAAVKAFAGKTGIDVKVVSLSTGELLGKVAAEGGRPRFDVLWVQGSAVMSRLARDGVLKPEPGLADGVDFTPLGRRLLPKGEAYVPITASTTAIEVNTRKWGTKPLPASWADLRAAAGTVAAKDPNLSGPAFQWLAGFFQTFGVERGKAELEAILTNRSLSGIPSGEAVNRAVITGDATVAIQQDSTILELVAKGEPVRVVYPSEGVTALPSCAGIATASTHETAARAFVRFLLSPEGQAAMLTTTTGDGFFAPLVTGIKANGARVDDTSRWAILDDEAAARNEKEWKRWFRERFVP